MRVDIDDPRQNKLVLAIQYVGKCSPCRFLLTDICYFVAANDYIDFVQKGFSIAGNQRRFFNQEGMYFLSAQIFFSLSASLKYHAEINPGYLSFFLP